MSDEKTIEALVGNRRLDPDQWYGVRATAYVRRTAAGRVETRPVAVQVVKVDSPDQPIPPDTGPGGGDTLPVEPPTAEPKA
jgi:hypothetical protein